MRKMMTGFSYCITIIISLSLIACSNNEDTTPPAAKITFPTSISLTKATFVTVYGTASDTDSGISAVRVNGIEVTSDDGYAHWQVLLPLTRGTNILQVETVDNALNTNSNAARAIIESKALLENPTGLVLDSDNNRVLVADKDLQAVLAVDLTSGLLTVISDNSLPDNTNALMSPQSLALDSVNNRALVLDAELNAVIAVDLTSGARTVISNNSFPNNENSLLRPKSLVLDQTNNRVLIIDEGLSALIAVDLVTGLRSVISDNFTPDNLIHLIFPQSLVLDSDNNRVLVADSGHPDVIEIDLATGFRATIPDRCSSGVLISCGSVPGAFFTGYALSMTLDSFNNRLLTIGAGGNSFLTQLSAVDLSTGARTSVPLFDAANNDYALQSPQSLVFDGENNRVLIVDNAFGELFAVNLETGVRSVILSSNTPDNIIELQTPVALELDSASNRLLTFDKGELVAVDLSSGSRSVLTESVAVSPGIELIYPGSLVLDKNNNRVLVVDGDSETGALLSIDLTTYVRTVISKNGVIGEGVDFDFPTDLVLDKFNNRVLVTNAGLFTDTPALLAVDLSSGNRTVISDNTTDSTNVFDFPTGIALDAENNRVLITDLTARGLFKVDLDSGKRTVFTDDTGVEVRLGFPSSPVLDRKNNRVLFRNLSVISELDLMTGVISVFNESFWAGNFVSSSKNLVLDSANDRLFSLESGMIGVIQMESGERVILSK